MNKLEKAIEDQKIISFNYDANLRIVEPYLIGITTKGNTTLSAYQVDGYSKNDVKGWKQFKVEEITNVEILEHRFEIRNEYNPNDKRMVSILKRITK